MNRLPVGVLGATGMVGQKYLTLLENHPWFEVRYVAASPESAGKSYGEAVDYRWHMEQPLSDRLSRLIVGDANDVEAAHGCAFVFSALEINKKDVVRNLENAYAASGIPVVSNTSAHRSTPDVPMIIPEINPQHLDVIPSQQRARGWKNGFIVVKPNCSLQSYLTPVYALMRAGYDIDRIIITTQQAISGAGYPGVPSLDILGNVIPYIRGEEEKTEQEPLKILGKISDGQIVPALYPLISATCTRVPVPDGHTASVNLGFAGRKASLKEILDIWQSYRALPQELELPSAPEHVIIYREEANRPQPRLDCGAGGGMAISVGRLRACNVLDVRFVGLSHNTVRGAAGGAILTAELLYAREYLRG
jgi:aspartate-semialdehyde dehydrogenase